MTEHQENLEVKGRSEGSDFVIKPSISKALLLGIINIIIVLSLVIGVYKLINFLIGEDILLSLTETLEIANLAKINVNSVIKGFEGVFLIGSLSYLLWLIVSLNNLGVFFEEKVLRYTHGIISVKEEIIKYGDVVRIRFNKFILGLGKIIIERYDVEKTIEIPFVNNIESVFKEALEIVNSGMKKEITEKIKKISKTEVEEKSVNSVVELLKSDSVSSQEILRTLESVSRTTPEQSKSNVFKMILFELVRRKKINRETVKEVVKELSKKRVIRIEDFKDIYDLELAAEEALFSKNNM